ncbi:hypothetical protein QEN19_000571 [Hanseniaspora menglaensis]
MSFSPYDSSSAEDKLIINKLTKDIDTLAVLLAEKYKIQTSLKLQPNQQEEIKILTLTENIKANFADNNIISTHPLFNQFQNILNHYSFPETFEKNNGAQIKKVRFELNEQDRYLDDIQTKLKTNKERIIQEIQPELLVHDSFIRDLEQGFDKGLINLNKINHDTILPAWKKSGGGRFDEVKRGFVIGFLLLVLFLLWLV